MDLEMKQAPYVETQMAELGVVETYRSGEQPEDHLHRECKPRQVSMIAIAGAIGTGLIIGSGTALARGGPASLFLAYTFTGTLILFVMSALGEMSTFLPMDKGFSGYATRMVDPAFGYILRKLPKSNTDALQICCRMELFFQVCYCSAKQLDCCRHHYSVLETGSEYFDLDCHLLGGVSLPKCKAYTSIIIDHANFPKLFHVSVFGEAEFYMSSVKILVLVVLILTCFIIALGGQPSHVRLGFSAWQEPGAFAPYLKHGSLGRFLGFWAAIVQSCFAYTGTEVVGIAFGETPNPRKNIPKAIRQTAYRIIFFYILGVLVLGMCVPYNNKLLLNANKAKTSAGETLQCTPLRIKLTVTSRFSVCHCHSSSFDPTSARHCQCMFVGSCAECSQFWYDASLCIVNGTDKCRHLYRVKDTFRSCQGWICPSTVQKDKLKWGTYSSSLLLLAVCYARLHERLQVFLYRLRILCQLGDSLWNTELDQFAHVVHMLPTRYESPRHLRFGPAVSRISAAIWCILCSRHRDFDHNLPRFVLPSTPRSFDIKGSYYVRLHGIHS